MVYVEVMKITHKVAFTFIQFLSRQADFLE